MHEEMLLHRPRAYNGKTYDVLTIEQRHSENQIPLLEPGTAFSTPLYFRWGHNFQDYYTRDRKTSSTRINDIYHAWPQSYRVHHTR